MSNQPQSSKKGSTAKLFEKLGKNIKKAWNQGRKELKRPSKGRTAFFVVGIVIIGLFIYWVVVLTRIF